MRFCFSEVIPMTNSGALIHPSDVVKPEWLLTRQSLHTGGLVVEHQIQPADQIETSGLSHHVLGLLLNGGTRQVNRFNGQEYDGTQQRGDCWLLPVGQPASWYWESTDEVLVFILDPQLLQTIALETECFSASQIELLPILLRHDPQLNAIASLFLHELTATGTDTRLYQESLTNLFAIHLLRHYCAFQPVFKSYTGGLSAAQLRQVLDYIHGHLAEDMSLRSLADQLHLSVHYFGRLFRQSMGKTPHQYVTECRLEQSKQLLKQTNLSVTEIAAQVGFQSQSHFITMFRQQMQVTPLQFRKDCR
jgi:AraC family transcriptional regulator